MSYVMPRLHLNLVIKSFCILQNVFFNELKGNMGFPGGSVGKESTYNAGDSGNLGSIPESRRSSGGGMATQSSILVWRILWTEEPRGYSPWGRKESDKTDVTERAKAI